jgi:hypothetical protein
MSSDRMIVQAQGGHRRVLTSSQDGQVYGGDTTDGGGGHQGVYNDEDDADSGISKIHHTAILYPAQGDPMHKYINNRDIIDEEALSEGGNGAMTFKRPTPLGE